MMCFIMQAIVVAENSVCEFELIMEFDQLFGFVWLVVLFIFFLVYGFVCLLQNAGMGEEEERHTELAMGTKLEAKAAKKKSEPPQKENLQIEMKTPLVGS